MKLKTVSARQGLMWVRAGLRLFARQPLGYTSLFALFGVIVFVLLQIPLLGPLVALALMPLLTVGFMLGTREALEGRAPHPGLMLPLLRDATQRRRLLQLGAAYAGGTVVMVLLSHLLDGGRLVAAASALANDKTTADVALQDTGLAWAVMLRLALVTLLSVVFWHAPPLMCWSGLPLVKALFASVVACARNWAAMAAFGATWVALIVAFTAIVQLLFALLGLQAVMGQAVLPIALLASTAFYASLYFSFVDSFELDDTAEPKDATEA